MPRGPRLDFPGAFHHVMARGIERCDVFRGDADRSDFVERLGSLVPKGGAELFAWSLMPNHFHLVVRVGAMCLSDLMRRLLGGYASAFNRRHGRCGHLFQNRFKSILVEEERYLLELVRYIHLNPIRAGIVSTLDDLDDYTWTGHAALLGQQRLAWQETERVLALFGRTRGAARQAYREFVEAALAQGRRPELAEGTLIRRLGRRVLKALRRGRESWAADERVLGSEEFVLRVLGQELTRRSGMAFTDAHLHRLVDEVASRCDVLHAEITSNGIRRELVCARAIVSYVAVRHYGFPVARVARTLNVSSQSVLRGVEAGPDVLAKRCWTKDDLTA